MLFPVPTKELSLPPTVEARSSAVEDYTKAIFSLESRGDQPVSTTELAERLGVTPGSVSAMLRKLAELGLATMSPTAACGSPPRGAALRLR